MTAHRLLLTMAPLSTATSARTITGCALVYGVVGQSTPRARFLPGSVTVPSPMDKVKLLIGHDSSQPAGYLTSYRVDGDRLLVTFHVPAGAAGDEALRLASQRLRDGLSVGVTVTDFEPEAGGVWRIRAARLDEVSLVALPGFENARVTDVAAARHLGADACENRIDVSTAALAAESEAPVPDTQPAASATEADPTETDAPVPVDTDQAQAQTDPAHVEAARDTRDVTVNVNLPAQERTRQEAQVYAQHAPTVSHVHAQPGDGVSLRVLAERTAAYFADGGTADGLRAALADVIPTTGDLPQYVGDLWRARRNRRPIAEALRQAAVTGLNITGFRINPAPVVAKYAGNKGDVPSNAVARASVTKQVQRFAGGWDIDRVFGDLGDREFIQTLLLMATDDYMLKTESYVVDELEADATVVTGAETVTGTLAALGAAASAVGANLGAIAMAPDAYTQFVGMTTADAPWWLSRFGSVDLGTQGGSVRGLTIGVSADLAAGTILALDPAAATFYERKPPVQVQAENIPQGGIDVGVFGYVALIVNDPRAVLKAVVTPAGP